MLCAQEIRATWRTKEFRRNFHFHWLKLGTDIAHFRFPFSWTLKEPCIKFRLIPQNCLPLNIVGLLTCRDLQPHSPKKTAWSCLSKRELIGMSARCLRARAVFKIRYLTFSKNFEKKYALPCHSGLSTIMMNLSYLQSNDICHCSKTVSFLQLHVQARKIPNRILYQDKYIIKCIGGHCHKLNQIAFKSTWE